MMSQPESGLGSLNHTFFSKSYILLVHQLQLSQVEKNHHEMCDSRHNVHHSLLYIHHFPVTLWWSIGRAAVGSNGVQGEQQGHVLDKKKSRTCETYRVSSRSAPGIAQKTQYGLLTHRFHSQSS